MTARPLRLSARPPIPRGWIIRPVELTDRPVRSRARLRGAARRGGARALDSRSRGDLTLHSIPRGPSRKRLPYRRSAQWHAYACATRRPPSAYTGSFPRASARAARSRCRHGREARAELSILTRDHGRLTRAPVPSERPRPGQSARARARPRGYPSGPRRRHVAHALRRARRRRSVEHGPVGAPRGLLARPPGDRGLPARGQGKGRPGEVDVDLRVLRRGKRARLRCVLELPGDTARVSDVTHAPLKLRRSHTL